MAINPLFIVKYQHHDDEDSEKYLRNLYLYCNIPRHLTVSITRNNKFVMATPVILSSPDLHVVVNDSYEELHKGKKFKSRNFTVKSLNEIEMFAQSKTEKAF